MRKTRFCLLLVILLALFLPPAAASGEEEIRGYIKGKGYQYVTLGEYPYDAEGTVRPVLWRVLSVDDGAALLHMDSIIDVKQIIFETDPKIIQKHEFRRISSYTESDLFPWINSEMLDTLMGNDPLRAALIEDPEYGMLRPLTRDECLNPAYGFSPNPWGDEINAHPERQAVSTPYARSKGLYVESANGKSAWWCISIKNPTDYKFGLVGHNGHISWGAYTNIKVSGLRLAVRLDLNRVRITGGDGTRNDPWTLASTGAVPADSPVPEAPAEELVPDKPSPDAGPEAVPESLPEPETVPESEPESLLPAEPAEVPVPEHAADGTALLSFIGDCSIGDGFSSIKSPTSYHSVVDREGYAWPFSLVKEYLASDDLTVANLEVVLTERNQRKEIKYPLRAAPDHVNILLEGSIEVVNTVNNHSMDYLRQGYLDTLAVLDEAGIARFGSVSYGMANGFDDLLVRDVNGIRFGFVGMTYPQSGDTKNLIKRVRKLKEEDGCDIVIVSLHWGRETYLTQSAGQVTMAKQLIDGGADVIYGHHPHVLQPMMFYQGKPIMFSTGNFTFGTMSKVDPHTGIFRFTYRKTEDGVLLSGIEVIPCQTSGSNDYRPFVLTDETEIRKTFRILSAKNAPAKCENPPEYFLETGRIMFDENGMIIPEM